MARPALEIADIFRDHGPTWRQANAGHVSLGQLKVMSAIESCRTVALGGHVMRCEDCLHTQIAYNSCRNRHCPKCQGYPKRLGVKIGFTSVLHTWGSAMTHHPHVHMIVPGGGISLDSTRWIGCRSNYLLPVKVLSRLFRRLMLEMLLAAHAGRLQFFGDYAHLASKAAFKAYLAPLHRTKWFVYSKRPFAGPEQVLAYLSRYTHRVAISNSRLIAADATGVTFSYKDYRIEGPGRYNTMTLKPDEFIRRFLMHVLPNGFHRIRHCGLLASGTKTETIARARQLIATVAPVQTAHQPQPPDSAPATDQATHPCPCCGGRMNIIETFNRGSTPQYRPPPPTVIRIDTSARANMPLPRQRRHRSSWLTADSRTCDRPIMRRNVVSQHTHRRRLPSPTSVVRKPP